jgi:hypothetical protein
MNNTNNKNIEDALLNAKSNGYAAFKNGTAKAPCQCKSTMEIIAKNEGNALAICTAWIQGQMEASKAA